MAYSFPPKELPQGKPDHLPILYVSLYLAPPINQSISNTNL